MAQDSSTLKKHHLHSKTQASTNGAETISKKEVYIFLSDVLPLILFCSILFIFFPDSRAYLHASRDLHVQTGSQLTLSCAVKRSSGDPDYVYWYRNEDVLNYSPHVKIEDAASPEEQPLVSKLLVENVQKSHSGNYTCAPSNAWPASVLVHVVDGN